MKWPTTLNSTVVTFIVALIFAGIAFVGAQRYLKQERTKIEVDWRERYRPTPVVVAAAALPAGKILSVEDLAKREMPAAYLPGGTLPVDEIATVIGQQLVISLAAGDALSTTHLSGQGGQALASRLLNGTRAVTVPVDEVSSQAGLVRPGDQVDLLLAEETTEGSVRCVMVKPLLESLKVLATGAHQVDPSRGADEMLQRRAELGISYSTMTLDVTPEQAQQLALALRVGDLIPLLRGQGDATPVSLKPRVSDSPACEPSDGKKSVTVSGSAKTLRTGRSVELWVGGDRELAKSQHWFSDRP
jgi:pilus assembly protein CpaB